MQTHYNKTITCLQIRQGPRTAFFSCVAFLAATVWLCHSALGVELASSSHCTSSQLQETTNRVTVYACRQALVPLRVLLLGGKLVFEEQAESERSNNKMLRNNFDFSAQAHCMAHGAQAHQPCKSNFSAQAHRMARKRASKHVTCKRL